MKSHDLGTLPTDYLLFLCPGKRELGGDHLDVSYGSEYIYCKCDHYLNDFVNIYLERHREKKRKDKGFSMFVLIFVYPRIYTLTSGHFLLLLTKRHSAASQGIVQSAIWNWRKQSVWSAIFHAVVIKNKLEYK